ncbi:MAG: hypothetical protein RDU24_00915 [Humidesulfovibrio sp.]|uniref:hypothetical protein n=1 Tax=Humidesulfovibrio sp. TaxID=2910988 RepID=UPI0027EA9EDC|nr:hypothetical protein [Humidesulfovibrio sp.]MDQ7833922.1 hypothetical protein [Humidesulfovibrio sp.]
MVALMLFGAIAVYALLAIVIVRFATSFAATEKWKKRTKIFTLIVALYFPVLEPLGSFLVYQTYGLVLARATVYSTARDVNRILLDGNALGDMIMMKQRGDGGASRKFAGYAYFEYYRHESNKYVEVDTKHVGKGVVIDNQCAKYIIAENDSPLTPFCKKRTITIRDNSGAVFGEYVEILWFGSHLSQWLASMTHGRDHSGTYSPDQPFRQFIQSVLVPAEQSE